MRRLPIGRADTLTPGEVRAYDLGRDDQRRPVEILVIVDPGGEPRAYRNLCSHLPVPLDGGSRAFLDDEGKHLRCGTHGALYRLEDGFCVRGPCEGSYLRPIRVDREGEELVLAIDPSIFR